MCGRAGWLSIATGLLVLACGKPCPSLPEPRPVPAPPRAREGVCALTPDDPACSPPVPRCLRSDKNCGPRPLSGFTGCYDPSGPRIPLFKAALRGPPDCSYDGECVAPHCGLACARYEPLQPAGLCMKKTALLRNDLLCGCVKGHCAVFFQ